MQGISLNLGAGAARGFAHIGVMRALLEHKIPFHRIIGVSMGALVGSIYSIEPDIRFVEERLLDLVASKAFQESLIANYYKTTKTEDLNFFQKIGNWYSKTGMLGRVLIGPGMLTKEEIETVLDPYLPNANIAYTRFPFSCVAVELERGVPLIFSKGSMRTLVTASMSMPMVFPPVAYGKGHLVDGGVLDKIGILGAKELGFKKIIAVDVSNMDFPVSMIKSGIDVMLRAEEIASYHRRVGQLKMASVVIQPIEGNIHWADYSKCKELIEIGYEKTISMMEEIKAALGLLSPIKRFFFWQKQKPKKDGAISYLLI